MNPAILKQKFSNLTLWKRGGERAPHKPLLALYALGRVLRNEDRFIPYQEVDRKLTRLLQEFGPDRKSYNPQYPFW
ncbi:MAG: restriction endonuclease, partial [Desulfococcaceae bacterium]